MGFCDVSIFFFSFLFFYLDMDRSLSNEGSFPLNTFVVLTLLYPLVSNFWSNNVCVMLLLGYDMFYKAKRCHGWCGKSTYIHLFVQFTISGTILDKELDWWSYYIQRTDLSDFLWQQSRANCTSNTRHDCRIIIFLRPQAGLLRAKCTPFQGLKRTEVHDTVQNTRRWHGLVVLYILYVVLMSSWCDGFFCLFKRGRHLSPTCKHDRSLPSHIKRKWK